METVWPRTIVQTCVVHLLRNSLRYAARQDWDKAAKLLKPVCTAPTESGRIEVAAGHPSHPHGVCFLPHPQPRTVVVADCCDIEAGAGQRPADICEQRVLSIRGHGASLRRSRTASGRFR
ncbi:hypothetical protein GCM10010350_81400 [Streptomyces galilaeus]|nr:hypothetical protein GCM10010350_81400 [Streptomyces galilaeus]